MDIDNMAANGPVGGLGSEHIKDSSTATFMADVVEASTTTPVIVGTSGTGQVETRLALFAIGSSFAIMLAIKKDAAAFFITITR